MDIDHLRQAMARVAVSSDGFEILSALFEFSGSLFNPIAASAPGVVSIEHTFSNIGRASVWAFFRDLLPPETVMKIEFPLPQFEGNDDAS